MTFKDIPWLDLIYYAIQARFWDSVFSTEIFTFSQ